MPCVIEARPFRLSLNSRYTPSAWCLESSQICDYWDLSTASLTTHYQIATRDERIGRFTARYSGTAISSHAGCKSHDTNILRMWLAAKHICLSVIRKHDLKPLEYLRVIIYQILFAAIIYLSTPSSFSSPLAFSLPLASLSFKFFRPSGSSSYIHRRFSSSTSTAPQPPTLRP